MALFHHVELGSHSINKGDDDVQPWVKGFGVLAKALDRQFPALRNHFDPGQKNKEG
jgi:hypothetical protein